MNFFELPHSENSEMNEEKLCSSAGLARLQNPSVPDLIFGYKFVYGFNWSC